MRLLGTRRLRSHCIGQQQNQLLLLLLGLGATRMSLVVLMICIMKLWIVNPCVVTHERRSRREVLKVKKRSDIRSRSASSAAFSSRREMSSLEQVGGSSAEGLENVSMHLHAISAQHRF